MLHSKALYMDSYYYTHYSCYNNGTMHSSTVYHPPPVTVKYNSSASQLQWHPPYSIVNDRHHEIFQIEPHILQYTVYIIDATGMIIGQVNTTETGLTLSNVPDDNACLIYRVSTWNNNGEGEMSEPVCGSLLHCKFSVKCLSVTLIPIFTSE